MRHGMRAYLVTAPMQITHLIAAQGAVQPFELLVDPSLRACRHEERCTYAVFLEDRKHDFQVALPAIVDGDRDGASRQAGAIAQEAIDGGEADGRIPLSLQEGQLCIELVSRDGEDRFSSWISIEIRLSANEAVIGEDRAAEAGELLEVESEEG